MEKMGVRFETNVVVGRTVTIDELMKEEGYDAVFVATGAGLPEVPRRPRREPERRLLRQRVPLARQPDEGLPLPRVRRADLRLPGEERGRHRRRQHRPRRHPHLPAPRRREGDDALPPLRGRDARAARRRSTTPRTRGSRSTPSPTRSSSSATTRAGCGRARCIRMALGEPDDSGRRRPVPIEGSEFEIPLDVAIVAVGTGPNPLVQSTTPDLATNRKGYIAVADPETLRTSKKGVFAGGDIVTGAATVILAMGAGRKAARSIDEYLRHRELVWSPTLPQDGRAGHALDISRQSAVRIAACSRGPHAAGGEPRTAAPPSWPGSIPHLLAHVTARGADAGPIRRLPGIRGKRPGRSRHPRAGRRRRARPGDLARRDHGGRRARPSHGAGDSRGRSGPARVRLPLEPDTSGRAFEQLARYGRVISRSGGRPVDARPRVAASHDSEPPGAESRPARSASTSRSRSPCGCAAKPPARRSHPVEVLLRRLEPPESHRSSIGQFFRGRVSASRSPRTGSSDSRARRGSAPRAARDPAPRRRRAPPSRPAAGRASPGGRLDGRRR